MVKSFSSREVLKMLEADGWALAKVTGDHHQFRHPTKTGRVTLPHPVKDIPIGTLRSIFRQAGMKWPPE